MESFEDFVEDIADAEETPGGNDVESKGNLFLAERRLKVGTGSQSQSG